MNFYFHIQLNSTANAKTLKSIRFVKNDKETTIFFSGRSHFHRLKSHTSLNFKYTVSIGFMATAKIQMDFIHLVECVSFVMRLSCLGRGQFWDDYQPYQFSKTARCAVQSSHARHWNVFDFIVSLLTRRKANGKYLCAIKWMFCAPSKQCSHRGSCLDIISRVFCYAFINSIFVVIVLSHCFFLFQRWN